MTTAIIGLQVALAVVLAVAGYAKLRDLSGSRQAVQDFGVPARLAGPLGLALPIVEIALAVLLLVGTTALAAAIAAVALFLTFVVAIGYNLSQGRQPDCHCFGQLHSEPAGWPTIFRNAVLTGAALLVVAAGGRSPGAWFGDLSSEGQAVLLLGAAILGGLALQARFTHQLVTQNRSLIDQVAVLATGSLAAAIPASNAPVEAIRTAAAFDIPGLDGGRLTLRGLLAHGKPVLLLFTSPSCGPCNSLLPDVAEWTTRFDAELTIALVSIGNVDDNRAKAHAHDLRHVGLQEWPDVSTPYGVNATPTAILIDADGMIRNPNANGRNEIRDLVDRTVGDRPEPVLVAPDGPVDYNPDGTIAESLFPDPSRALGLGQPVPRIPLPNLAGGYSSLEDFRGQPFMLIFWSTSCGFCQRMLPDMLEWEAESGPDALRLVFASAGTPEDIRDLGLQSTVLLDDDLAAISKAFGAPGTPSAAVIDAQGRVASGTMIGADAILDFLDEQIAPVDSLADHQPVAVAS